MVLTEVVSLVEGEWLCYRGDHFNGGENGHVTEGQCIGRRMVMLERWSVKRKENGHLTEVVTLMEGEWSCYRCGH